MTPKWQHDCDPCVFLDHYRGKDWYYCRVPRTRRLLWTTLIARSANEPSEYASAPLSVIVQDPAFRDMPTGGFYGVTEILRRHAKALRLKEVA